MGASVNLGAILSLLIYVSFIISLILSVVFFIVDGIKAKMDGRKRHSGVTAWFITMIVLGALALALLGAFAALISRDMSGM